MTSDAGAEASRTALLTFLDALPVVTYIADAGSSRLHFISAEVERLLGYPREQWLRDEAVRTDRIHPQDRYRVLSERAHGRAERSPFASEYRLLGRGGRTVWVRDEAKLVRDEAGMFGGDEAGWLWCGFFADLTGRRLAESELRARAARQSAVALLSQRALAIQDQQQLFAEAAGLVRDTLEADHALVVHRPRPGGPFTVAASAPPSGASTRPLVPPGSIAHAAVDGSAPVAIMDHGDEAAGAVAVDPDAGASAATPINAPGRGEAVLVVGCRQPRVFTRDDLQVLESTASVLANAISRQAMESELGQAEKLSALGRLSAGIAHDFNNIIGAVLGFTSLLEPAVRHDPRAAGHLEELRDTVGRASALVDQLLTFSRQGQATERVHVDLDELVARMETMLVRLLGSDVSLRHERGARATVWGDSRQIEQVVLNLVLNARDAMPEGGTITVRTGALGHDRSVELPPGDHVVLEVEDDGVGIDEETLDSIFEPFFTTKAAGHGTGLGLSTVLGTVERHGGRLAVDSEVGRGTRFTVYLPASAIDPASAAPAGGGCPEAEEPRRVGGGAATVAVVDDQKAIRTVVREMLSDHGYVVVECEDSEQCLSVILDHSEPIDLLLTDVTMPGLSGPELARRLWQTRPGTPVVLMSGYADSADLEDGAHAGPVQLLRKPFSIEGLLGAVAGALGGAGPR